MVDQHHLRPGDGLARAASPCARARAAVPELIGPPLENVDQLLVDVAAAVVPDVDDDSLPVPELVDLVTEALERWLVHRADVDVRDLPTRLLLDELPALGDPLLV